MDQTPSQHGDYALASGQIGEHEAPDPGGPRPLRGMVAVFTWLGGATIAVMTVHILVDVVSRNFFNHPFSTTMDFVQFWWMPLACFSGIIFAQYINDHIIVETIFPALAPSLQRLLRRIVLVVSMLFSLALLYFGLRQAIDKHEILDYALASSLPTWPPVYIIPISMAAAIACMIWQFIDPPSTQHELEYIPHD